MAAWIILALGPGPVSDNNKLALIDMGDVWMEGLPVSSDGLGQGDKQQLLWGYPGVLWLDPKAGGDWYPRIRRRRR